MTASAWADVDVIRTVLRITQNIQRQVRPTTVAVMGDNDKTNNADQSRTKYTNGWLGGLVVRTSDSRLAVAGSAPGHDTAWLFLT